MSCLLVGVFGFFVLYRVVVGWIGVCVYSIY